MTITENGTSVEKQLRLEILILAASIIGTTGLTMNRAATVTDDIQNTIKAARELTKFIDNS